MKIIKLVAASLLLISCTSSIKLFKKKINHKKLELTKIENYTKSSDTKIDLTIKNSTFSGFSGCNDYNGTFSINKDYVHFKLDNTGTKVCLNIEDERKYLQNLVHTTTIIIQGKKLYFKDIDEKKLLEFKRD